MAGDLNPWAIIISTAPMFPSTVPLIIPITIIPMWITDEYAINLFISVKHKHTNLTAITPHIFSANKKFVIFELVAMVSGITLMSPYPPNFSRIPARIMEPLTGASTCAFGSHKCTPHMGTFTRNANVSAMFNRYELNPDLVE